MSMIEIFCDGACSGNPGPGGYGCIIRSNGSTRELSGGSERTTNNRMELSAAIAALEALQSPSKVAITSDSQYLVKGMTEWIEGWIKRGWVNSQRQPVLNRDLWERLLVLSEPHQIEWIWVRGHAGHLENEICNGLAQGAVEYFRSR